MPATPLGLSASQSRAPAMPTIFERRTTLTRTTSLEELRFCREAAPVSPGTPGTGPAVLRVSEVPPPPPIALPNSVAVSPRFQCARALPHSEGVSAEVSRGMELQWWLTTQKPGCTCKCSKVQWSCDDCCLRSCGVTSASAPTAGASFDDISVPARPALRTRQIGEQMSIVTGGARCGLQGASDMDALFRPLSSSTRVASSIFPVPWEGDAGSPTWEIGPHAGLRGIFGDESALADLTELPPRARDDLYLLALRSSDSPPRRPASPPAPLPSHLSQNACEETAVAAFVSRPTLPLDFQLPAAVQELPGSQSCSPISAVEWHSGLMSVDTAPLWAPRGSETCLGKVQRHAHEARLRALRDEPFSSGRSIAAEWLRVPAVPLLPGTQCHDDAMVPEGTGYTRWLRNCRQPPTTRSLSVASRNASRSSFYLSPEVPRLTVASSLASEGSEWQASQREVSAAVGTTQALMHTHWSRQPAS
jgi:hypothetical protein